MQMGVFLACF